MIRINNGRKIGTDPDLLPRRSPFFRVQRKIKLVYIKNKKMKMTPSMKYITLNQIAVLSSKTPEELKEYYKYICNILVVKKECSIEWTQKLPIL